MRLIKLPDGNIIPRLFLFVLLSICFATSSFSSDAKKDDYETGTYSKIYWVKANPDNADGIFEYFDSVLTPEAKATGEIFRLVKKD